MQNMVLSIFEVSEHDNQPELEHELLPQYVINTGEHDGIVCFFRNDILEYETATRNISTRIFCFVLSSGHEKRMENRRFSVNRVPWPT